MNSLSIKNPQWNLKDIFIILVIINVFGLSYGAFFGEPLQSLIVRILPVIPDDYITYFFIASVIQTTLFVGLSIVFAVWIYGGRLSDLGINLSNFGSNIIWGVTGGITLLALVMGTGALISHFFAVEAEPQPFAELLFEIDSTGGLIIPFIMAVVLAPIGEEVFFRGFVYPVFRRMWSLPVAMIVSGILFASLHFDLIRAIPLAVGGIGLAWLYEKTGSIVTPIIAHAVWNGIMTIMLFTTLQM
ncbi:hypothetical protein GGQ84_001640 [Desulfitispora alkaliphila]|uniref:CPBP family intramembrane glutamic endopeptidase n=1 Tax=Desulfitispora alkaliphila TaxID=622674 RepID=UPI003D2349D5